MRARACTAGRARPMKFSSRRLIRIITGLPICFDIRIGSRMLIDPAPLLPNPPPQNSQTSTTFSGSTPAHRATAPTVRAVLCVEPCT